MLKPGTVVLLDGYHFCLSIKYNKVSIRWMWRVYFSKYAMLGGFCVMTGSAFQALIVDWIKEWKLDSTKAK